MRPHPPARAPLARTPQTIPDKAFRASIVTHARVRAQARAGLQRPGSPAGWTARRPALRGNSADTRLLRTGALVQELDQLTARGRHHVNPRRLGPRPRRAQAVAPHSSTCSAPVYQSTPPGTNRAAWRTRRPLRTMLARVVPGQRRLAAPQSQTIDPAAERVAAATAVAAAAPGLPALRPRARNHGAHQPRCMAPCGPPLRRRDLCTGAPGRETLCP